ncbi:MAG: hypothetical protein IJ325_06840 [Clostridia bacterium]|nr:hypothetical protein [Clostridia bacterium]
MFKKIISTTVTVIVLILCVLIILRCCVSADRSVMTDIVPGDALRQAYDSGALTVITTEDPAAEIAEDGYYSVYGFVYFPEISQVQITIRYNKSLYTYADLPEGTEFSYTLGDENGNDRVSPTSVDSYEKGIYRYRRLVFDNVTVSEDTALYCFMQITENYESENPVHHAMQPLVERELTKEEISILNGEA